jgi:hypothetical protein
VIRAAGTVYYVDGREEPFTATQAEFAAWELQAMRLGLPPITPGMGEADVVGGLTMARFIGYVATQRAKGVPERQWEPRDEWEARVAEVSMEGDAAEVPPSPPVRSVG